MRVYLLATLDTKGAEADWVRCRLRELGLEVALVDTGCLAQPQVPADVSRETVFRHANTTVTEMQSQGDRAVAVASAARGVTHLMQEAQRVGDVAGILGLGGSAGTTIATAAMRALPLGVPKIMVSTLASGDVAPFVGERDIVMMHSVVDLAGINRISRKILGAAAGAMVGMVQAAARAAHENNSTTDERPLVAATMFGVTTPCVEAARRLLEEAGYEVLVFHATGSGGRTMEGLIRDRLIHGVLDITTTELADLFVGGVMSAGADRLTAASQCGVPQVVSVGATDMVNFWGRDTVPAKFAPRHFHVHNAHVTLMRTTAEECRQIGQDIANKMAAARGPSIVLLPQQGVSALDRVGQPFDDRRARDAMFDAIQEGLPRERVELLDYHLNDREFAEHAARRLLDMMR